MNDTITEAPQTGSWVAYRHAGEYLLSSTKEEMRKYRGGSWVESLDGDKPFFFDNYLNLCWWCGTNHINPKVID